MSPTTSSLKDLQIQSRFTQIFKSKPHSQAAGRFIQLYTDYVHSKGGDTSHIHDKKTKGGKKNKSISESEERQ